MDFSLWRACDRAAAEAARAGALAGGVRSRVQRRLRQQFAQVPCVEQCIGFRVQSRFEAATKQLAHAAQDAAPKPTTCTAVSLFMCQYISGGSCTPQHFKPAFQPYSIQTGYVISVEPASKSMQQPGLWAGARRC